MVEYSAAVFDSVHPLMVVMALTVEVAVMKVRQLSVYYFLMVPLKMHQSKVVGMLFVR
jgi:hypothetical protein